MLLESQTLAKQHYGEEIDLTSTYTISVYAKATGFVNSDIATATIKWHDGQPEFEDFSDVSLDKELFM